VNAFIGVALDAAVTRSRSAGEGTRPHGISNRARARRTVSYAAAPAPAWSVFGKRIHHYFKPIDKYIAFDLGHAGEPHGTVVIAEEQTAGRGRAGRTWHSEEDEWHLHDGAAAPESVADCWRR